MKKFKYMLSALVVALVLTCVAKAPMAVKAAVTVETDYEDLTVTITGADKPVFYQVVKDATATTGKVTAWMPATKVDDVYKIDISAFSKAGAILYTTDKTKENGTAVAIKATASTVKATIDYSVEGEDADAFTAIFATLVVADDKKVETKYDKSATTATADLTALTSKYALQWKRGANGFWLEADDSFANDYSMMRTSNSTLYVRAYSIADSKKASLPSKEAKIKVAKTAAAPTVKVDYAKGTIALKNGMEFVFGTGDDAATYFVPTYSKTESTKAAKVSATDKVTKTKVSALTPAEILTALGDAAPAAGADLTIEVRTSATAKKYASWYTTVTVKTPLAVPVKTGDALATYVYDAYNKTLTLTITATAVTGRTLEYAVAGADADITSLKFTKVEDASKAIDLSKMIGKKYKYVNNKGEKKEQVYEKNVSDDVKTVVFIRWAAVVDKNDATKNVFASTADLTTIVKEAVTVDVTAGANTVTGVTATEIKDAYGNTFSTTATKVTKDTKMTLNIKPTVTTGYTVTAVSVKLGESGTSVTATWDAKAKAWVAKDVVAAAEGALAVTYTVTAPTPTPAPTAPAGT